VISGFYQFYEGSSASVNIISNTARKILPSIFYHLINNTDESRNYSCKGQSSMIGVVPEKYHSSYF